MKAKICDKCKHFYELKFENKVRIQTVKDTKSRYTKSIDLCPECQEKIINWLNGEELQQ